MSGGTALHPSGSPASSLDATRWLRSSRNPPLLSPTRASGSRQRPVRSAEEALPLRDATHRNESLSTPGKGHRGYESETGGMLPHKPKPRTCAEKEGLQRLEEQRWLCQGEGGPGRDNGQARRVQGDWDEAGLLLQESTTSPLLGSLGMPQADQQWIPVSSSYPVPQSKAASGLQQEVRASASSRSLEPRGPGDMGPSGEPRPPRQLLIRSGPGVLQSPPPPKKEKDKAQQQARALSPGPSTATRDSRPKNKSPGISPLRERAAELLGGRRAEKSPQRKALNLVVGGVPGQQASGAPSVSPSRGTRLHPPSPGGVAAGAVVAIAAAGKSRQWAVSPRRRATDAPADEGPAQGGRLLARQPQESDRPLSPAVKDENLGTSATDLAHARRWNTRDLHQLEPRHRDAPACLPAVHQLQPGAGAPMQGAQAGPAVGLSQGRLTSALGSSFRARRLMEFLEDSKIAACDPWDEESTGWQAEDAYSVNGERLALAQGLVLPGEEDEGAEGGLGQAAEEMEAAWLKAMKSRKARPAWAKRAPCATSPARGSAAAGAAAAAGTGAGAGGGGVDASTVREGEASAAVAVVAGEREELRALVQGERPRGEQERPTEAYRGEGSPRAPQPCAHPLPGTAAVPGEGTNALPVPLQENPKPYSLAALQAQALALNQTVPPKEEGAKEASRVEEWVARHFWAVDGSPSAPLTGSAAAGGADPVEPAGSVGAVEGGGVGLGVDGAGEDEAAETPQLASVTPQLPGSREAGRHLWAAQPQKSLGSAEEGEEAAGRYTRSRSAGRQWGLGGAAAAEAGEGEQGAAGGRREGKEEMGWGEGKGWAGSGHQRASALSPRTQSPARSGFRVARGASQEDAEGPERRAQGWFKGEEGGHGHRAVSPPTPGAPRRANTGARMGALSPLSRLVGLNSGHTKESARFLGVRSSTQTSRTQHQQQQQQQQNARVLSHQYQHQQHKQHHQQGQGAQKALTYKQAQQRQLELADQARRMGAGPAKARQDEGQTSWPQAPPLQGVLQSQRRSLSPNGIRLLDLGGAFAKKAAAALMPQGAGGAQGGAEQGGGGSVWAEADATAHALEGERDGRGAAAGAGGVPRSTHGRSGARKNHTPTDAGEGETTPRSSGRHQRVHTLHAGSSPQGDKEERLGSTRGEAGGYGDLVSPRAYHGASLGVTRQGRDRDRFKAESGGAAQGDSSGYTAGYTARSGPLSSIPPYSGSQHSQHSSQSQGQASAKKPGKKWVFPFRAGAGAGAAAAAGAGAGGGQGGGAGSPPEEVPQQREKSSHQKAFPVPPLSLLLQLPEHHQAQGQGRPERRHAEGSPPGPEAKGPGGGGARGGTEGGRGASGPVDAKGVSSTFPPNSLRANDRHLPQRYRNKSPMRIAQKPRHQPGE